MRRALLTTVLLFACTTAPPPAPVDDQTRGAIQQLTEAIAQQPTNMPWIYVLATYHDQAKQTDDVVRLLARLDELGWEHGVNPADFRNSDTRAFHEVVTRLRKREPRVKTARVAFTIAGQRDLVPEGIAYDPVDDVFYLSSIEQRKVVHVDRQGNATAFVPHGQDGMLATLGLKVDAKRRLLWVASTSQEENRSLIFAYSLADRRLVKKIEATPALLNDLVLLDDGSLFATDMGRGKVLRLASGGEAFEEWADDSRYPNGIAVSDDQRFLYVADFRGVTRFSLADQSRQRLETKALLNGIDGLAFYKGTLIGIQNAIGSPRVIRIHPDDGLVEILESKNEQFEIPLTGVVVGGEFFFIANPGLRTKPLQDLIMLAVPL